jgi:hypothetical protein
MPTHQLPFQETLISYEQRKRLRTNLVPGAQACVHKPRTDIGSVGLELPPHEVLDWVDWSTCDHIFREGDAGPLADESAVEGEACSSMARVAGWDEESGRHVPTTSEWEVRRSPDSNFVEVMLSCCCTSKSPIEARLNRMLCI